MNYIKRMETQIDDANITVRNTLEALNLFRSFVLTSHKFTGREPNGERRDWISCGDVAAWIDGLRHDIIDTAPACALTMPKKD